MNPQHFHTDTVIPSRPLALEPKARLGGIGLVRADEVEHDLLEQREVLRRVVLVHHGAALAGAHADCLVKASILSE